jgi:putative tryptophan/tyrosine transport system substrate-binding protein
MAGTLIIMRRRGVVSLVGGAATWSLAARAQQKAMPVIGSLNSSAPGPAAPFVAAFIRGLRDTGYVEGQNLIVEYRYAEGHSDRLPALAADLVARKVDVIQTSGGAPAIRAAKEATSMIPIVFGSGDDPVEAGFVASLARPGGNLTGVSFLVAELHPKRFELLRELIPQAKTIALLVNPNSANGDRVMREMQDAARPSGVQLLILKVSTEDEIDTAFATLVRRQAGGLLVQADPFINSRRDQVVTLAAHHAIPAIYEFREFATAGRLISYGPSLLAVYRQVGIYAGRILKGIKPADLPVEQPTTFELAINVKTAKALGLTIPPSILARADEVIE